MIVSFHTVIFHSYNGHIRMWSGAQAASELMCVCLLYKLASVVFSGLPNPFAGLLGPSGSPLGSRPGARIGRVLGFNRAA